MITLIENGDLFKSKKQTLIVPVNTDGIMGAGLALAFKNRFLGLEDAYKRACRTKVFEREGFFVYNAIGEQGCKVLCVPTKRHWVNKSKKEWINKSLEAIALNYHKHDITSMAFPMIGCGLGKLTQDEVLPLLQHYMEPLSIEVEIYLQ